MSRKATYGNSKMEGLADTCKGFVKVVESTELEYDHEAVQTFLIVMARTSIGLLSKEAKAELGIV